MLKLIISGVWICALSLGSVYFSMQMASSTPKTTEQNPYFGGLDYLKSDVISIPVISDGIVHGYFLTRLVFTVDTKELSAMSIPPKDLITDELYTFLVGNRVIDFPKMDNFDVAAFRKGLKAALNKRIGKDVFHDVMVEQIDYLTKQDIRSNLSKRHYTMKSGEPVLDSGSDTPAAEPASAKPSH